LDDDVYLTSLRQLDKNISAAIAAGQSSHNIHHQTTLNKSNLNNTNIIRSSFNPNANRLSFANRQAAQQQQQQQQANGASSSSFHQNLASIAASFGDNNHSNSNTGSSNISKSSQSSGNHLHYPQQQSGKNSIYFQEARPFPYDRSSQTRLNTLARQLGSNSNGGVTIPVNKSSHTNLNQLSAGNSGGGSSNTAGYNRANSTHKLYQDLNDYNKSREFNKSRDFKGHLV
jgi:hypothetical protein